MSFISTDPDSVFDPAAAIGTGSSVDKSIPTFSGTGGKQLQDPATFHIDPALFSLYAASGLRNNLFATSQTVLDAEKTYRSGFGGSTDIRGNFYMQNNAGNKSVRLGTTFNTAGAPGLVFYSTADSSFSLFGTSNIGSFSDTTAPEFPPAFSGTNSDLALFQNNPGVNATPTLRMLLLGNGSIWQFANGVGGNFPVIVTNDPTNTFGIVTKYTGLQMSAITAGNFVQYGSPTSGFAMELEGSDFLTGTGDGGDITVRSGESVGGISGDVILKVSPGVTAGQIKAMGDLAHSGSKAGFYSSTPVVQASPIADASGGAIIDAEARTALNSLLAAMRSLGLIDT